MSGARADLGEESPPTLPSRQRARLRRLAVPVTAVLTVAILGLIQLRIMRTWAEEHDKGIRDVLMKWDAGWMTKIAEFGYSGFSVSQDPNERIEWQSVAFFPGYPVMIRVVSAPLTIFGTVDATLVAAVAVSVVASLAFAWGIAQLAVDLWRRSQMPTDGHVRPPASVKARVVLAIAATVLAFGAPMSFLYWMPYSEAVFSALTIWTLVMVLRRRYLLAGVLTLFAGLTRITAVAVILTLCVAAVLELWQWARRRTDFPASAVAAPAIGFLGIGVYLRWANHEVADIGGYFAAQKRGWRSGFDMGAATLRWMKEHTIADDLSNPNAVGYTLSSWAMILVALLCVASLWTLLRGWIPWQVWLTAMVIAGMVLASDGIMHSRPRLLMMPVLLLLLPYVISAASWLARSRRRRIVGLALMGGAAALWFSVGMWVSGWMLLDFRYGI